MRFWWEEGIWGTFLRWPCDRGLVRFRVFEPLEGDSGIGDRIHRVWVIGSRRSKWNCWNANWDEDGEQNELQIPLYGAPKPLLLCNSHCWNWNSSWVTRFPNNLGHCLWAVLSAQFVSLPNLNLNFFFLLNPPVYVRKVLLKIVSFQNQTHILSSTIQF